MDLFKPRFRSSLFALVCFAWCAFIAMPFTLFARNDAEFNSGFLGIAGHFILPLAGIVLAGSALLALLPARPFRIVLSVVVMLLALVYLQGNFMVWDYGPFDGGEGIEWENYAREGMIDIAVWIALLLVALTANRFIARFYKGILVFLVLAFSLGAAGEFVEGVPRLLSEDQESKSDSLFQFSSTRNVIIVVLDTFASPAFEAIVGRSPAVAEQFSGFTFFRNTVAPFSTTAPSIPAILTGREYDNSQEFKQFLSSVLPERSLPSVLDQSGWQVDVMSMSQLCSRIKGSCHALNKVVAKDMASVERREALELLDLDLFRILPQPLRKKVYNHERWFLQRMFSRGGSPRSLYNSVRFFEVFDREARVSGDKPSFKFIHLMLPHPPCAFDANCKTRKPGKGRPKKQDYENQGACALKLAGKVIEMLKKNNLFEKSMIIVTADHGYAERYIPFKNSKKLPIPEQAMPLLLVKPFGKNAAEPLAVSQAPASLLDISSTIGDSVGMKGTFPGESLLALSPDAPRVRRYKSYGWNDEFWGRAYLPRMQEYEISGDVRDPAAWEWKRALGH